MIKRARIIISLIFIAGTLLLTRCDETKDVCPDGMIECNVNGDSICVPKSIGC